MDGSRLVAAMAVAVVIIAPLWSCNADKEGGLSIECGLSRGPLYADWRGGRLTYQSLDKAECAIAYAAAEAALDRYPPIRHYMSRYSISISLVASIRFDGLLLGGLCAERQICIACKVDQRMLSGGDIAATLYHEISSEVFSQYRKDFPDNAWHKANPPGFQYSGDSFDAIRSGEASDRINTKDLQSGFLWSYARANIEEDYNSISEILLSDPDYLKYLANQHYAIKTKTQLAYAFWCQSLNGMKNYISNGTQNSITPPQSPTMPPPGTDDNDRQPSAPR